MILFPAHWRRTAFVFGIVALFLARLVPIPAMAEAPPRCAGQDLLAKMAQDKPADYAAIVEAAKKVPDGDHLFWRIEGKEDRPDSFLFGTIHYSDDRATDLPAGVRTALAGAHTVALELAAIPKPGDLQEVLRDSPELLAMPAGRSLYDLFTLKTAGQLRTTLTAHGASPDQATHLQPWFVTILLSAPDCERRRQAAGMLPVDGVVIKLASEKGTPIVGLESLKEQLSVMASMPLEAQAAQLAQLVSATDTAEDRYETLLQLYLHHRIGTMFPMMEMEGRTSAGLGQAVRNMNQELIANRNANMIERALPLIEKGGLFIAVGSLHLPGEKGLVERLRARGYKVTPAD